MTASGTRFDFSAATEAEDEETKQAHTLTRSPSLLRKSQSASFSEEKNVAVGRWSNNSLGSLLLRSKYALMTGGSSGFQGISWRERRKGGFWGK